MYLFVLLFIVEATVRKYLISSSLVIILKYFPLFAETGKLVIKKMSYFIIISIVISIFSINPFYFSPVAAFRDYLAIFAAPIVNVFFVMVAGHIKIYKIRPLSILHLIIFGSYANSIVTILQQLFGPRHWLSVGVTGEFDSHTFGGGLIAKANGIFANSNGVFQAFTVIIAFALLSLNNNAPSKYKLFLKLSIALSAVSAIVNISSRTYSFSVLGASVICLLYASKSLLKPRTIILSMIFMIVGLLFLQDSIQNILSSDSVVIGLNRVQNADAPWLRVLGRWGLSPGMYPDGFQYFLFPKLGIGSTLTGLSGDPTFDLLCPQLVKEWEGSRILCSYGFLLGLITLFIYKVLPCIYLMTRSIQIFSSKAQFKYTGLLLLVNSFVYLLCFPMRSNVTMSNVVLFGIAYYCLSLLIETLQSSGISSSIQIQK